MKLPMSGSMSLPINLRKWMIGRFAEQREKENEAMEASRRRQKSKAR